MKISDVLVTKGHDVVTVQQSDRLENIVHLLARHHIGAVVVLDRWQKLAGIFSERDLVHGLAQHGAETLGREVQELMTTPVITCSAAEQVEAVLGRMTHNRIRHLPVLENGNLAGLVSIGDLVHSRLGEKELEAGVLLDLSRMRA